MGEPLAETILKHTAEVVAAWALDEPYTPEGLAEAFVAITQAVRELQAVQSDLEGTLAKLLDAPLSVPGLGLFERKQAAKHHTWDTDRLLSVVVATAVKNRTPDDNGEIVSPATAIEKMIAEVAHIDYWRLQALDRHGLDGRKYRDTEWGRARVKHTPELEQAPEGA